MNTTVENITAYLNKKLSDYGALDRIQIILELREVLDGMEREAMIEEYELEPSYFE